MIPRRGPALALVLGCTAALLAGCSGGGTPATGPTTTSTRQLGPPIPAPVLPAAATANTPAGAAAFYRHWIATYNYTYATLSSAAIKKISLDTCVFCHGAQQDAEMAAQQKVRNFGGDLVVTKADTAKGDVLNGAIVHGVVAQQPGRSLNAAGKVITSRATARVIRMAAEERWALDHWVMVDIAVNEDDTK